MGVRDGTLRIPFERTSGCQGGPAGGTNHRPGLDPFLHHKAGALNESKSRTCRQPDAKKRPGRPPRRISSCTMSGVAWLSTAPDWTYLGSTIPAPATHKPKEFLASDGQSPSTAA